MLKSRILKKVLISIAVFIVIATALLGIQYHLYMCKHKDCFQGNREPHIQLGMTKEELVAILGKPRYMSNSATKLRFDLDDGQSIIVWINNDVQGVVGFYYVDTDAFSES